MLILVDFPAPFKYNLSMEDINLIIGKNLLRLRKNSKMTQLEFAEKFGYSNKSISKWETGETMPSIQTLSEVAKFYHVTLDDLTKEEDIIQKNSRGQKVRQSKKLTITLLAISLVWLITIVAFVYIKLLSGGEELWQVFIWAIPCSSVVGLVFNSIWGRSKVNYFIISILLWSLLLAIYLQFLDLNLSMIFLIGIPGQVSILLWSGLNGKKTEKH